MQVKAIKVKLFGKVGILYRVLSVTGEVLQVLETEAEAQDWIAEQR
jgi:hypothetical protein